MLSPSQGIPAKWPRCSTNRNPLSIELPLNTEMIDYASCTAFRLNKGSLFPQWAIPSSYSSRLQLSDWSYNVTSTLCTCQESPEHSWDEWGQVQKPDTDASRSAAWKKRGSTTKLMVKMPWKCWKGLCCFWQGAITVCSLPCKHSYWHPEAVLVTLD